MGLGDDLMITGIVEQEHIKYPDKQIVIGSLKRNLIFDSLVYLNNPKITLSEKINKNKPVHFIDYNDENRFYINYEKCDHNNLSWRTDFKLIPGRIYFSKTEINDAKSILKKANSFWLKNNRIEHKGIIFFESYSTKKNNEFFTFKMKNKNWGEENWIKLIDNLKDKYLIIQSVHEKAKKMDGVFYSENEFDFRTACAVLSNCDMYLGNEGGFGHAAAALNKKALIYFGGWISPQSTGYDMHENIYYDDSNSPCGAIGYLCDHCEKARQSIKVEYLEEKVNFILE
jgi:ADP-heptose:LPS heptosyltransferase